MNERVRIELRCRTTGALVTDPVEISEKNPTADTFWWHCPVCRGWHLQYRSRLRVKIKESRGKGQ